MSIIYLGNNHTITLAGLTNCQTGALDTGATVTVTIVDSSGTQVSSSPDIWPLSMPLVSESPTTATYRATLPADLVLAAKRSYVAVIDATGSGGQIGHWEYPIKAQVRSQ